MVDRKQINALPNLFPYKQQILQQMKDMLPNAKESTSVRKLDPLTYGLVTVQNKPVYLPKCKDLLVKKTITKWNTIADKVKIVLQVLDARNTSACTSQHLQQICQQAHLTKLVVITKIDTINQSKLQTEISQLQQNGSSVLTFTTVSSKKNHLLQKILSVIRDQQSQGCILVAGKPNVGKHTLIMHIAKYARVYQMSGCDLFELQIAPGLTMLDAPFPVQNTTQYPLFTMPSALQETSLAYQQEQLIKMLIFAGNNSKKPILNHNEFLIHYGIQDYISMDDALKKIGKMLRIFGKGGMIDLSKTRIRILSDWFSGNLNNCLQQQF